MLILIFNGVIIVLFTAILFLSKKYILGRDGKTESSTKIEVIEEELGIYFTKDTSTISSSDESELDSVKREFQRDIIQKSAKMTQSAQKSFSNISTEQQSIESGGKMFSQYSIDFRSALPRNETEFKQDMTDLLDAVKNLESFDQQNYISEAEIESGIDIGKSMFYDRITSRLYRLMRKEKYNTEPFLSFGKIAYLGLKNLKNISYKDMFESLNFMKEAGYIQDYIEINPQLTIITQCKEKVKFTNSEKVVLALAYDDDLTIEKLVENSKWKKIYAEKVVNGLINKEIAVLSDNNIKIIGFETTKEKQERMILEKNLLKGLQEKEKLREKQQKTLEKQFKIKTVKPVKPVKPNIIEEEIVKEEDIETKKVITKSAELKKLKIPTVKSLKPKTASGKNLRLVKQSVKTIPQPAKEVSLVEGEITGIDDDLKKKITEHKEKDENIKKSTENGSNIPGKESDDDKFIIFDEDFEDLIGSEYIGDDLGDDISEEAIVDAVMSVFEQFEHINGGLMDIRSIHHHIKELYPDLTLDDLVKSIKKLKEMGLVTKEIKLKSNTILLFKDIIIDKDMLKVLETININGWMTKNELSKFLKWDEEKTLNTMKKLQDIEVLRLGSENKVIIPGLNAEKNN